MMIAAVAAAFGCPGTPLGSFGEKFRKERERRGFTLDDVSNVTKINSRMLKAIEEEHFELLPGGVFNKGFVRAYAKHLGFNDEDSVTEYLAALRQAQVDAQTAGWQAGGTSVGGSHTQLRAETEIGKTKASTEWVPAKAASGSNQPARDGMKAAKAKQEAERETSDAKRTTEAVPSRTPAAQRYAAADLDIAPTSPPGNAVPWRIPAALFLVIVLAGVLWNRHSRAVQGASAHLREGQTASVSNATQPVAAPVTTPNTTPGANKASEPSAGPSAVAPGGAPSQGAATRENPSGRSSMPAAVSASGLAGNSVSDRALAPAGKGVGNNATLRTQASPLLASKPAPVFTLRIRASETSWIAVSADGQPIVRETLIAPASTVIRATREITVRVGNAAGVSFELNGKEIPAQGGEAEVKTFTFDDKGIEEGRPD